ncbi:hypothetical protein [Bradyrhizobium sp. CCBAU 051011]|uniref:hypothetical protein n=1 Tax=Bradyrhizobium sp. CCBAU 051011 TaxID=858422 RepID=UPI00137A571A|nr:hypothetical protein [Bradyrhizobium sp. CCBAU 051011]
MATRKRARPYKRDVDQVPTIRITTVQIMSSPEFELGLSDVRRGIPFDWRNGEWNYERGRLFGHIAPLDMQLRIGGKLNPKAVALYDAASNRRLVI